MLCVWLVQTADRHGRGGSLSKGDGNYDWNVRMISMGRAQIELLRQGTEPHIERLEKMEASSN